MKTSGFPTHWSYRWLPHCLIQQSHNLWIESSTISIHLLEKPALCIFMVPSIFIITATKPQVSQINDCRPKKPPSTVLTRVLRDEDPCLVSTVTESILPLIPDRTGSGSHVARLAQGQQVCSFLLVLLLCFCCYSFVITIGDERQLENKPSTLK